MNIHKLSLHNCELLSALTDGELMQDEFPALLRACEHDHAMSAAWNNYHVIGEVLRSPGCIAQLTDITFLTRLNQQLAKEPSFGSGCGVAVSHSGVDSNHLPITVVSDGRSSASNDGSFRWKMVAGFACVAAVSAIAWSMNVSMVPAAGPQLAEGAAIEQVVVASPQGLMVRDARLEELLAAHKQLGATSALPVPSGFLRNATFETQQSLGR